jgi:hypothetical protein
MNRYRVDRAPEGPTPCGMVNLLFVGDNLRDAMQVYRHIEGGKNGWNQPDPAYGVLFSEWNGILRSYVPRRWKNK